MSAMRDESRDYTRRPAVPRPVAEIATLMSTFPAHWAICGGWAIDAWLGRTTREHVDVDVSVFHDDYRALFDHLSPNWQLIAHDPNVPDATTEPWTGRRLGLPGHVHARRYGTYAALGEELNPTEAGFGLDIELGERSGNEWVLSREPYVVVPLAGNVAMSPWGIPMVTPEVLLAFKALEVRSKDQQDFEAMLPHLTSHQRAALRTSVAQIDAVHPWLKQLARPQ